MVPTKSFIAPPTTSTAWRKLTHHCEPGTGNWRGALCRSFKGAIHLLQTDRFGRYSSAVDDVKSWLAIGGVCRVKLQLDRQMEYCDLEESYQEEIHDFSG